MENSVYLIYSDGINNCFKIIGYIYGTEDDAIRYCIEYNTKCKHIWDRVTFKEIRRLHN